VRDQSQFESFEPASRLRDAAGQLIAYGYACVTTGALGRDRRRPQHEHGRRDDGRAAGPWQRAGVASRSNGTAAPWEVWARQHVIGAPVDFVHGQPRRGRRGASSQIWLSPLDRPDLRRVLPTTRAFGVGGGPWGPYPTAGGAFPCRRARERGGRRRRFSLGITVRRRTDDIQFLTGYDVLRDGVVIGSVGSATTSFTDGLNVARRRNGYTVSGPRTPRTRLGPQGHGLVVDDPGGAGFLGLRRRDSSRGTSLGRGRSPTPASWSRTLSANGWFRVPRATHDGTVRPPRPCSAGRNHRCVRPKTGFRAEEPVVPASEPPPVPLRDGRPGQRNRYIYVNHGSADGPRLPRLRPPTRTPSSATTIARAWHALELHLGVNVAGSTVAVVARQRSDCPTCRTSVAAKLGVATRGKPFPESLGADRPHLRRGVFERTRPSARRPGPVWPTGSRGAVVPRPA